MSPTWVAEAQAFDSSPAATQGQKQGQDLKLSSHPYQGDAGIPPGVLSAVPNAHLWI